MRSAFFFCTRFRVYLIELPLLALFALVYHYNGESTDLLRYYPLLAVLALAILFVPVFFFRVVTVSEDEVRMHGLFSSRDRVLLKKDTTISLIFLPKKKMLVLVSRKDGMAPGFSWAKPENYADKPTVVFRESAFGAPTAAKRALSTFGFRDTGSLFAGGKQTAENDFARVTVLTEEEKTTVEIEILALPEEN